MPDLPVIVVVGAQMPVVLAYVGILFGTKLAVEDFVSGPFVLL